MKNYITNILFIFVLLFSTTAFSLPKLSSFPSATATIFLDFDGHTVVGTGWNNGNPLICAASGVNDTQITEIFNRVSEDFRPFNINITTDSTVFIAAPLNRRVRIIITPTSGWYPGVGGISYIGSFTWGDDTPGFVFSDRLGPDNPKYIAECCTHESGHTLGLSHQSTYDTNCNLVDPYNLGVGSGQTGWAPVMGNSYYRNMTGWSDGPTPYGCASVQDNLTTITTQNGFTYRTDDYAETLNSSTYALTNSFTLGGIISTNTDKDAFKYTLAQTAAFHFEATPFGLNNANAGADLDIQVMLYNSSLVLINSYTSASTLNVVLDTTLSAGTYYIVITGTGNSNTSDYGSLGSYTITGFNGPLPIHDITLSGNTDNNKHNLSWHIIADEPVKSQVIEYSTDGAIFRPLTDIDPAITIFSYASHSGNTIFYRLKVTSVINQTAYSNIIALKGTGKGDNKFTVSTFIQNDIIVNATEMYDYRLYDAGGRMITSGKGIQGINKISMMNKPGGLYIIQIFNPDQTQTERIIKQ